MTERRKTMNIAIAQSGGPTAAINSSLCGVFDEAEKYNEIDRIYGLDKRYRGHTER